MPPPPPPPPPVRRHLSRTLKKSPCPGRGSKLGPFDLEANTLLRSYKSRLRPQGSTGVSYTLPIPYYINFSKIQWDDEDVPIIKPSRSFPQLYDDLIETMIKYSVTQMVKKPTRDDNILDLFMTSKPDTC